MDSKIHAAKPVFIRAADILQGRLFIVPQIMTILAAVMRSTDTWQVLDLAHGREAIGRDDKTTFASRPNAARRQDAGPCVEERMICEFDLSQAPRHRRRVEPEQPIGGAHMQVSKLYLVLLTRLFIY